LPHFEKSIRISTFVMVVPALLTSKVLVRVSLPIDPSTDPKSEFVTVTVSGVTGIASKKANTPTAMSRCAFHTALRPANPPP
jgi:hypothetical protein